MTNPTYGTPISPTATSKHIGSSVGRRNNCPGGNCSGGNGGKSGGSTGKGGGGGGKGGGKK